MKSLLSRNSCTFRNATYVYGSQAEHIHANLYCLNIGKVKGLWVLQQSEEKREPFSTNIQVHERTDDPSIYISWIFQELVKQ